MVRFWNFKLSWSTKLIFSSNIKGKPSHKIVSDGMPLYIFLESSYLTFHFCSTKSAL